MGTPQAAVASLAALIAAGHEVVAVYSQPDRPAGRGNRLTAPPVKEFAAANGIAVFQPTKIRNAAAAEEFRSLGADLAVVVAYGRILPDAFLSAFPKGAVNVHFSLLPKYRGAAPVNWAIVKGETETGVTTMQMDSGLDTGDILLQSTVGILPGENSAELMTRLAGIGAQLLVETLRSLDELPRIPQDHTASSLAPIMKKEDGFIDWTRTALEIVNRVRGFQPFPTSFTTLGGAKLKIWRAQESAAPDSHARRPGEIVRAAGGELVTACGDGTYLALIEIQAEGKRRMIARDFLNGVRIEPGTVLGEHCG